jgi:hypothetical protein
MLDGLAPHNDIHGSLKQDIHAISRLPFAEKDLSRG